MDRNLFEEEHLMFRDAFRKFIDKEVVPHLEQWEHDGVVSRDVWLKAGGQGFLCMYLPEKFGGAGMRDFRYNTIVNEELAKVNASGLRIALHNDIVVPYLDRYATEEQRERWFPGLVAGSTISAVAMSEPGAGSDLAGMGTKAVRDGDDYILNGQKTFITNGILNDLVVVACKTNPDAGAKGISLLVVERGMAGYERGRNLDKIGMKAQDTAELFFHDVRVPAANLLGEENRGFVCLMEMLPQERLSIAVNCVAAAEAALEWTLTYAKERKAFGQPIGSFQNSRFALAEVWTEVLAARTFVDRCIVEHNEGRLTVAEAAGAKWWCSELQQRCIDKCLQLHGGYGYMTEYPIAKAYQDARARRIYGGTTEIMKEIIGRSLGF